MFRPVALYALLCMFITGVIGCSTNDGFVEATDFKESSLRGTPAKAAQLEPGDSIEISVEVDGRVEVPLHLASINFNGIATLPIVGDVKISGLSLNIARSVIAKRYGALYVSEPVIMLTLVETPGEGEWGYVTVTGRIGRPGRVQVQSNQGIKLTELIQEAGGFSPSAKKSDIRITRTESNGRRTRVSVDFEAIGEKGDVDADISLYDGDIVYVPERIF